MTFARGGIAALLILLSACQSDADWKATAPKPATISTDQTQAAMVSACRLLLAKPEVTPAVRSYCAGYGVR